MKQRGFTMIELLIVAAIIGVLIAAVAGAILGEKEWEAFKAAHSCKIVGQQDGSASVGFGMTGGANGGGGPVVLSTPGKTGWLCDDGVTYWKNR